VIKLVLRKVLLIGHRGAGKLAPENTLKSFQKAIDLGADYIEFDVHGSKDGEIVIMHDKDTSRTTGHNGKIIDMTLSELKELDCGEGERIPTLKELIAIAKGKIGLQIEIKAGGMTDKIYEILKGADIIGTTLISSFIHKELDKLRKIDPSLKLAPLVLGIKKNSTIRKALNHKFNAIHPPSKLLTKRFLNAAHAENLLINIWTVDSLRRMKRFIKMGIDGIITNNIETAKEALGRK